MCISDTHWLFLQTTSFENGYLPAYLGLNTQCDLWRIKCHQNTGHLSRSFLYPFYSLWLQEPHGNSNKEIRRSCTAPLFLGLNIKVPLIK